MFVIKQLARTFTDPFTLEVEQRDMYLKELNYWTWTMTDKLEEAFQFTQERATRVQSNLPRKMVGKTEILGIQ